MARKECQMSYWDKRKKKKKSGLYTGDAAAAVFDRTREQAKRPTDAD